MITEWAYDFILTVVANLVTAIPAPAVVLGDISAGVSWMLAFNAMVPLVEMLQGTVVLLVVSTSTFVFQFARFLIAFVPGIGGSGP